MTTIIIAIAGIITISFLSLSLSLSQVEYKGATDLVTETDLRSEQAILDVIRAMCPTHAILGEEGGVSVADSDSDSDGVSSSSVLVETNNNNDNNDDINTSSSSSLAQFEYLWIVDPLDGTTNFAHRYPSFGVSVALLHKGTIIIIINNIIMIIIIITIFKIIITITIIIIIIIIIIR